jgi:predicted phosphodiesterase
VFEGGDALKPIKCDLSRDHESIDIITLADAHIGDAFSNFKLLQQRIAQIESTPNLFCILGGDLMNTATRSSKSDIYSENLPPMEQIKRCVEIFGPIKDKILCIVPGNHELRTYKSEGIDMTAIMAAQMGLTERYSDTTALAFVRVGELENGRRDHHDKDKRRQICYSIYVTHGGGGGRKEGGKINRLADLAAIVDADIYIHAHTHLPAVIKEGFFRSDPRNCSVALVDKLFVNTNAYLKYGGYGDLQNYKPSSMAAPIIHLGGRAKSMTATL